MWYLNSTVYYKESFFDWMIWVLNSGIHSCVVQNCSIILVLVDFRELGFLPSFSDRHQVFFFCLNLFGAVDNSNCDDEQTEDDEYCKYNIGKYDCAMLSPFFYQYSLGQPFRAILIDWIRSLLGRWTRRQFIFKLDSVSASILEFTNKLRWSHFDLPRKHSTILANK